MGLGSLALYMGGMVVNTMGNLISAKKNRTQNQKLEDQRQAFQKAESNKAREYQERMTSVNQEFQRKLADEQNNVTLLNIETQKKIADMNSKIADRQMNMQKIIAEKQMEFQKIIAENNNKLQEAIAERNYNLQIRLAAENRELQKFLTIFNAYFQRETALLTAVMSAERNYQLSNFPVTLIRRDFPEIENNKKLHIIFSPPKVSFDRSLQNYFADCEGVISSNITDFLQKNSNTELYSYFSGAWRDPKFSGTASHQSIFSEFSSMPFLIIDCNITGKKLNYSFSFWNAGDSSPHSYQLINNLDFSGYMNDLIRERTEKFIASVYNPVREALKSEGKSDEEIAKYFNGGVFGGNYGNELLNRQILLNELNLRQFSDDVKFEYTPSKHENDALIETISNLNSIISGIVIDFYHLYSGRINSPAMLKNIRQILERLPNTPNFKLRDDIKKYITDEYDACMSKFTLENDSGKEYIENITPVNICLELASAYSKLEDEPSKTDAVEEAAEKWCSLLGIDYKNISSIFKDMELKNNVFSLLQNDDDLVSSLKEIYWLSNNNGGASKNVKLICDMYREYGKQNRENLI